MIYVDPKFWNIVDGLPIPWIQFIYYLCLAALRLHHAVDCKGNHLNIFLIFFSCWTPSRYAEILKLVCVTDPSVNMYILLMVSIEKLFWNMLNNNTYIYVLISQIKVFLYRPILSFWRSDFLRETCLFISRKSQAFASWFVSCVNNLTFASEII